MHTVELRAFYQIGGLNEILKICNSLTSNIKEITEVREEERSDILNKTLIHAYGGLKVALHLLHPIISAKPLFESPQTLLLITRDKKETEANFFDPNNFLVKLRLTALPLLRSLWEAPWLVQAPLGVSRSIVLSVLELVNGENEQSKSETIAEGSVPSIPRSTGPDENRVQMLVDMGFPRSAAERALTQTRNNVNAATELLLSNPFAFPPDPDPTSVPPNADSESEAEAPTAELSEETSAAFKVPRPGSTGLEEAEQLKEEIKTVEGWKKALDEAREPLQGLVSRQALLLVDEHQSLLFELHAAFVRPGSHQPQAIHDLVQDITSFSPCAFDVREQPLANRCRLLALVLCEAPSSLDDNLRKELLDALLALMLSGIDIENPPKWLASHLLVTEALLTLAEEPRTITLPKEDEPINPEPLTVGLLRADAKNIVFDFSLRLLTTKDLPSDELLSVLRLLVFFTKDRKMVKRLVEVDGLPHLFRRVGASEITGGSSYIITILRHVVEDHASIHNIMSESIKRYFNHPRNNTVDISTYVRSCNAIAFRDTGTFLDVTKSLCNMIHPYAFGPQITLKPGEKMKEKPETKDEEKGARTEAGDVEMKAEAPALASGVNDQYIEHVVHLLITELMVVTKTINEASALPHATTATTITATTTTAGETGQGATSTAQPSSPAATIHTAAKPDEKTVTTTQAPPGIDDKYQYACFLMQCLTELLFSYDACKVAFLSFAPKKRNQTPSKEPANKYRSATLHFLLNDIINPGTINPLPESNRRRLSLCNWAMLIVVSICVDTSTSPQEPKDISTELITVRKFVLETLNRSLKDVSSVENLENRYGKLLAYADLCYRLLTVRFSNTNASSRKQQDEVPTHIAKIMLEKNFVSTLTSALSEVDLNYPHVRTLVDFILRPLQYL